MACYGPYKTCKMSSKIINIPYNKKSFWLNGIKSCDQSLFISCHKHPKVIPYFLKIAYYWKDIYIYMRQGLQYSGYCTICNY